MKKSLNSLPVLAIISIIVIFTVVIIIADRFSSQEDLEAKATVITDKSEYVSDSIVKINIENLSDKMICFSSCYPSYIDKKEADGWKSYPYYECETDNIATNCIQAKGVKAFEFDMPAVDATIHRLAVPVCDTCEKGDMFRKDFWIYSDEFNVTY